MSIVITTPAGHISRRVLQQLLKAGADVSVVGGHPEMNWRASHTAYAACFRIRRD